MKFGVYLAAAGAVTNYGTIRGLGSATGNAAVKLAAGGHVLNGGPGSEGADVTSVKFGVDVAAAAGTVTNYGTISNTSAANGSAAIYLQNGGAVLNGGAGDDSAALRGGRGVSVRGASAAVTNYGKIAGFSLNGVILYGGGSVVNKLGATITGIGGVAIYGVAGSVRNDGTINGSIGYGVSLYSGAVTNGSPTMQGVTIEGGVVVAGGPATVCNAGTIEQGGDNTYGVRLLAGGTMTNGALNNSSALIDSNSGLYLYGGAAINFGNDLRAGLDHGRGADLGVGAALSPGDEGRRPRRRAHRQLYRCLCPRRAGATVTNFGTIEGTGVDAVALRCGHRCAQRRGRLRPSSARSSAAAAFWIWPRARGRSPACSRLAARRCRAAWPPPPSVTLRRWKSARARAFS